MRKGLKTTFFCILGTVFLFCLAVAAVMLGGASKAFATDANNTEDNKFEVAENRYLRNGNFEEDQDYGNKEVGLWGWALDGNGAISTEEKHSGNNALKISATKMVRYLGSLPVFETGKSYTLGVWAKFSNVSGDSAFAYQYEATAGDGQKNWSGQRFFIKVAEDNDWTYLESTYDVSNAGGQLSYIYFYNTGSCDLYIDDIVLYEAHASENVLSVTESQFINIYSGGAVLNGWAGIGSATSGFVNYGINLFGSGKTESWNYEWPAKLEKETSYVFSFMYKVSDNSGMFYAYYQNSNDGTWAALKGNGLSNDSTVANTDWKMFSSAFTTGSGELSGGTHRFGFVRGDVNSTIIASNFSIVKVVDGAEEIFPNGGVEKGNKGIPEGWMLVNDYEGVTLYQSEGYNGAGLVLTRNSEATQNDIYIDSAATYNIPVEVGGAYKITFKMKITGSPVKAEAYLNGDGAYTYVSRSDGYFYESKGSVGWSDVTAYMVLDPNDTTVKNVRLRIHFTMNAGESVQILLDEFAMEKVAFVKVTDGGTVTRDYVQIGSEYVLPASGEEGKLVLYKTEDGTYYGSGEKIAVSENLYLTAENKISYAMENGAYIRVNEPTGIKFCTEIESSAVTENVKVGISLTRNNSSVPFYIEGKIYSEENGVRKYSYALVDIDETNYNTEFTATAYIEINGKKIYLETSVKRSIAQTAYLIKTSEGYETSFNSEQKAVVEKYASYYTEG